VGNACIRSKNAFIRREPQEENIPFFHEFGNPFTHLPVQKLKPVTVDHHNEPPRKFCHKKCIGLAIEVSYFIAAFATIFLKPLGRTAP
jgi:hypothetical protein